MASIPAQTQPHGACSSESADPDGTQGTPQDPPSPGCFPAQVSTSPAYTESLIEQTLDELLTAQPQHSPDSPAAPGLLHYSPLGEHGEQQILFARFLALLEQGLAKTAQQITFTIKADLQGLGAHIETIESKLDSIISRTNQNTTFIKSLQHQLDQTLAKIDDLENRSRRYNFCIPGMPESVKDVDTAVHTLLRDLLPDLPSHRLDLDRAHWSLQPQCP